MIFMKKQSKQTEFLGKWHVSAWQILTVAVLLIAAIVAGVFRVGNQVKDPEMAQVVLRCESRTLTNQDLAYYFWTEYYYALGSGAALDPSVALDAQMYDESRTWQQYLLENVEQTMVQTQVLVHQAEEEAFQMPQAQQEELDQMSAMLEASAAYYGFTDESGAADVNAYLSQSYGQGADAASFIQYMEDSYLAAAYADALYYRPSFSEDEVTDYFTAFADDYAEQGVLQTADHAVQIRDILIVPESTQQSDWDAAREKTEQLLQTWEENGATEEVFSALAIANSMDSTSALSGGLREFLDPEEVDSTIAGWCFDAARQPGDTAALQAADGYHALYFCSVSDHPYWYEQALSDLRYEAYVSTLRQLMEDADYTLYPDQMVLHAPGALEQAS